MKVTQTYYMKDADGEYFVAQPQPTLREMEPEDIDDTMSIAERIVRIVLAKAKGVCLSKVHAIDHAGNSYLREASATQCANAIGALNIQPLIDQVKGILSLSTTPEAAPQPPKLSDERILELAARAEAQWNAVVDQYNQWGQLGFDEIVILISRAIEREILGSTQ